MNGENQPLVTDEPLEAQKDFRNTTHCFKRIYGIYLELIKIQNMTTCNRLLDLETLRFRPFMPQNPPPRTLIITLNGPHSLSELLNHRLHVKSPHLSFACKKLRNNYASHKLTHVPLLRSRKAVVPQVSVMYEPLETHLNFVQVCGWHVGLSSQVSNVQHSLPWW